MSLFLIKVVAWTVALSIFLVVFAVLMGIHNLVILGLMALGMTAIPAIIVASCLLYLAMKWWWPIRDGGWNPPWKDSE